MALPLRIPFILFVVKPFFCCHSVLRGREERVFFSDPQTHQVRSLPLVVNAIPSGQGLAHQHKHLPSDMSTGINLIEQTASHLDSSVTILYIASTKARHAEAQRKPDLKSLYAWPHILFLGFDAAFPTIEHRRICWNNHFTKTRCRSRSDLLQRKLPAAQVEGQVLMSKG